MIFGKIQIQKCKKSNKGMKNVRNPHILRTLPILKFFGLLKICWDFIWLGYCLNRFITLRRWSNDFRKNPNSKILKNLRTLPILYLFRVFKIFWDIIWLGCCLNKFITLRRWSNDIRKNPNPKILKNAQGYEECEDSSHSSYAPNSPLVLTF